MRSTDGGEQAEQDDEVLAEPHATLGFIRFAHDLDWDGAEADFLTAIERDPDYATARQWYALYLSVVGRYDEAIEQSRRAVDLEPTSALANRSLASTYLKAGRYEEGMEQLETARQLDPEHLRVAAKEHQHLVAHVADQAAGHTGRGFHFAD